MANMPAALPPDVTPVVGGENGHVGHSNIYYDETREIAKIVVGPTHINASAYASVNEAAAALPSGGGILNCPSPLYMLTAPLLLINNVTVAGAGIDATTFRIDPSSWANFGSSYMIRWHTSGSQSASAHCTVRDLTVDGNLRAGGASANQGGGIAVGDHWKVERVRFYDFNYFKLWINSTKHVRVPDCEWVATGADLDNIGGGGSDDIIISNPYFAADLAGNVFDHVKSTRVTIRGGRNESGHAVYFEGCTDCEVDGFHSKGPIALQSAIGYASQTECRNPKDMKVTKCELDLLDNAVHFQGIALHYQNHVTKTLFPGGGNLISGNTIKNVERVGILKHGFQNVDTQAGAPQTVADDISDNTIINTNLDGTNTWNTGNGIVDNACIALLNGYKDNVSRNHGKDDQGTPTTPCTVSIGATGFVSQIIKVDQVLVQGNTKANLTGNTVSVRGLAAFVLNTTQIKDNPGYNPQGVATITVTASPFTYTNNDYVPEDVHISGGTVSIVAKNGVTLHAATGCQVHLEPSEAVTVTYSSAPTMTKNRY